MPKTYKRRSTRSHSTRTRRTKRQGTSLRSIVLALSVGILILAYLIYQTDTQKKDPYTVTGAPSISADFINSVLAHYRSPAHGKGQALYDNGLRYGIDPAYALAFFMEESDCGTRGMATITHSLGNIRATSGHPSYKGYRMYATWEEGFEDWYKLIANLYVQQWGLNTVDEIIPVYAPAADNNDEQAYIHMVKYLVDTWRSGTIDARSHQ